MPNYSLNHVHHESSDPHAAAEWYKTLFGAALDDPYERGGAIWIRAHLGDVTITITDRESSDVELSRLKAYDHIALTTDDFDATVAHIKDSGVDIWSGPTDAGGFRIMFVNGPDNAKIEIMEQQ